MLQPLLDATAPWLVPAFTLLGSPVTWLELAAFMLSLAMVGCNLVVNPTGWPLAIVASLLYALLFVHSRLYGEASLQIFFASIAGWGWWQWLRGTGDDGQALRVHRMTRRALAAAVAATALAWPAVGWMLAHLTDSDVPFLDALPTVASVTGQLMLGRKLVENWPTWFVVNVFSVGLFTIKGLWLTVLLYALFAVLSLVGWKAWAARLEARDA